MNDLIFMARGYWRRGQLSTAIVPSTYDPHPTLAGLIQFAWDEGCSRPGVHLFDGPLCRFERLVANDQHLHLDVSHCRYKQFFGTNGSHPEWADQHGWNTLANAIGTSAALVSSDGWLIFGRRSHSLALYPGWAHPFGGILEPGDSIDLISEMQRELHEEIGLADSDISDLACIGLVRDPQLRQPELIYLARSLLTRHELESRLDPEEHSGCWSVRANGEAIALALRVEDLTPVTRLVLQRFAELTI